MTVIMKDAIKPNLIEIDLDHDLLLNDTAEGEHGFSALKAMGVRLALIDFGRQDNSLDNLANDQLDSLKLSPHLYQEGPDGG